MFKLSRFATLIVTSAAGALLLGGITACSQAPNPNAKKVLMACLAVTNVEANKILGVTDLGAFKLSGENSPVHVCEYNNAQGQTLALLKIVESKSKNPAADLAQDADLQKALFKSNVVPIQIHPASGFGDGAYYADNTQSPTATAVQLHFIEDGYNVLVQVNNPKDLATGETQVTALAQQTLANIKNKSAFQALE